MSPTERTLELYRAQGYAVGKVERWIERTKQRIDLFGCIDLVAIAPIEESVFDSGRLGGIIGLQATSGTHHADHRTKALCEPLLGVWLQSGGRFHIVTWSQRGGVGKRKLWTERVEELTLADFNDPIATARRADAVAAKAAVAEAKKRERAARRTTRAQRTSLAKSHEV